jgi:hypothetical protein
MRVSRFKQCSGVAVNKRLGVVFKILSFHNKMVTKELGKAL